MSSTLTPGPTTSPATAGTAGTAGADPGDRAVASRVAGLESGAVADDLVASDCLLDLSLPQWRLQAGTAADLVGIRRASHPVPGRVRVERVDRTEHGFVIAFEERWEDGQHWYCREQARADVSDGRITELAVYCTGDWDEAVQQRHAAEVRLVRP